MRTHRLPFDVALDELPRDSDGEPEPADLPLRDRRLNLRLTRDELLVLEKRAALCGKAVTAYARETALGHEPQPRRGVVDEKTLTELNRVGVNLNQLVRLANREGLQPVLDVLAQVGPELQAAIRRVVAGSPT